MDLEGVSRAVVPVGEAWLIDTGDTGDTGRATSGGRLG